MRNPELSDDAEVSRPKRIWAELVALVAQEWAAVALVVTLLVGLVTSLLFEVRSDNIGNWLRFGLTVLLVAVLVIIQLKEQSRRVVAGVEAASHDLSDTADMVAEFLSEQDTMFRVSEKSVSAEWFGNPTSIALAGVTLNRTVEDASAAIVKTLSRGGRVEVYVTEPTEATRAEFPLRFDGRPTPPNEAGDTDELTDRHRLVTRLLERIVEDLPDHVVGGRLTLHRLPFIPSMGFIRVADSEGTQKMRCEIYHRNSTRGQTSMYLNEARASAPQRRLFGVFNETLGEYKRVSSRQQMFPSASQTGPSE